MASFEIVQQWTSGKAVLKRNLGEYSMDDLKAERALIKCWCKIVTSAAIKKRRDDVGYVPIFYLFSKAGFTPYLGSFFV